MAHTIKVMIVPHNMAFNPPGTFRSTARLRQTLPPPMLSTHDSEALLTIKQEMKLQIRL